MEITIKSSQDYYATTSKAITMRQVVLFVFFRINQ